MSTIDNVLLFRCVQIVRKLMKQDRRIGIFCNLSPAALAMLTTRSAGTDTGTTTAMSSRTDGSSLTSW